MSEVDGDEPLLRDLPERDLLDTERLVRWMKDNVSGFTGPLCYAKFPGGQSNPTYRIDTPSARYVLRRRPMGNLLPSAHQIDREYRVISALHPTGVPVARPLGLCEDAGVIGSTFYVMEMIEGWTIWDGAMPDLTPDRRGAHYHALVDTLADLHDLDPASVGLQDFGRQGNYFERQVGRWTKQYRRSQTERLELMERLIDWLPRTLPPQTRSSIVHGDYRIDNVKFAPGDDARVLALLDWELSTVGDPVADLTYLIMSWVRTGEDGARLATSAQLADGVPTVDDVIDRYCARTGRDGVPDLNGYLAFNLFRTAGIVQGVRKRAMMGNASSVKAEEAGARVPMLAAAAWQFARAAGA